jgi:primary-amine oxidase
MGVEGHEVDWEGWKFKWQFREIEGLVLTDVYFRKKKVLKYIGLAEIYVPYATGSPRPIDFSLGGFKANPMPIVTETDCYAKGSCRALMKDGSASEGELADVMIHADDIGFAYAGNAGRAPGKKLVLWSMCHFPGPGDGVNNDGYTYVIRWKFFNDGRIRAEVGATGGLQHLNIDKNKARGVFVGDDVNGDKVFAPSHVHNFYFRVDLDVDGESNSVQELNYVNDKTTPMKSRALWSKVDKENGFYTNPKTFRSWRVLNPDSLNAQGRPRSYQIVGASGGSWRDGDSYKVLRPDIMFTKFRATEFPYSNVDAARTLLALGNYLNKERIVKEDVVVWQRISFMHLPRTEDWPAQPIVWHGFDLMPRDFLDTSPLTATK